MSQNIERRLAQMTPRDPDPELKRRVLGAVGEILAEAAPPGPRRGRIRFRPGAIAAAALVASLMLNYVVSTWQDRRLTRLLGLRQTAEISAMAVPVETQPYVVRLLELIRQASQDLEETQHATPEENPQVDRDLRGCLDRPPFGGQHLLRQEYGNRA